LGKGLAVWKGVLGRFGGKMRAVGRLARYL